ncbi:Ger(x)C family spore germination protein [Halobacillus rhizosphaerae]|uniref:Ger(x)C family spore germination protein n=1 Tax=Halobacillus rhizosphaerae TaxID=3064889 RepID=UPI00398B4E66
MKIRGVCMLLALLLLTGCWDQRQFKDVKLVLAKGFDQSENGKIIETVSIPSVERGGDGPGQEHVQIISTEADSVRDAREKIDQTISNSFDPAKLQSILIGSDLAKKGIYPILDDFYRNPDNNLNSYLALVDGKARDVISLQNPTEVRISKYISGLLDALVTSTHFTGKNLQNICSDLIEPGRDFTLPILTVIEGPQLIKYQGLALFHGDVYTGESLNPAQSELLMLLEGYKGKFARLTKKVEEHENNQLLDYLTFNVMKVKQKLTISAKGSEVSAKIDLNMRVRVVEFPSNHLDSPAKVKKLDKILSKELTKDAEELLQTVQEANSDVFAIGRQVKAYHPEVWGKLDWDKTFPKIKIEPNVTIDIQETGVIN